MDYKEKYEQVIERLKDLKWVYRSSPVSATINDVFPELAELAESEDEKIRKNCIHFLELQKEHHAATFEIEECISWLERQGEQKPAEWSEEDSRRLNKIEIILRHSISSSSEDIVWLKSIKDRVLPQPKQEWSEEDEIMCNSAINFIALSSSIGKGRKNTIAWLNSLKCRCVSQPKKEWSEEDDKMLEKVIKALSAYGDKLQYEGFCHNKTVIQEYIDWLKYLRPKQQWKPSEKQIEALKEACREHYDPKGALYSLCEDLVAL